MLSRTADHLYWMSRYLERAENTARFLEVANRLSLTSGDRDSIWQPVLTIAGGLEDYRAARGTVSRNGVLSWAVLEPGNPSSILQSLRFARENAHAVRSVIPNELWESVNASWLDMRGMDGTRLADQGLTAFCDWVKERAHLCRGISYGTMVRDEPYHFLRLGTFLERADNTARLLGVRAKGVTADSRGNNPIDQLHWAAVLRSVGAFKAYRTLLKSEINPAGAAEMLILMHEMPRSLHACMDMVSDILGILAQGYECTRLAGAAHAALHWGRLDTLLGRGLDRFVERFLIDNNALGAQIHADFLLAT